KSFYSISGIYTDSDGNIYLSSMPTESNTINSSIFKFSSSELLFHQVTGVGNFYDISGFNQSLYLTGKSASKLLFAVYNSSGSWVSNKTLNSTNSFANSVKAKNAR
ncbi:MAG: hypothetical protein NTU97_03380, partial [Candidatus Magasanikbacteria bacterium]|nr:hypothetical protein [Candidatus Magasanikbacteria bacterium]